MKMQLIKKNKNVLLFIGLLLLGGVLHSRDADPYHFTVTVMYCVEYLLYFGLILSWIQSVNQRLLPTRSKRYLMAAACLMLLFLAAQFIKYRIAVGPGLARYCWYVYYIPILLIPTLFLMTCFRLFRGEGSRKPDELLFLVPAGLLALGVLTNDLHMKAFLPDGDIAALTGGASVKYSHGFLYFAAYAWAGCAMAAGIVFLIIACRKSGRWKKAIWPLAILTLIPVFLIVRGMIPKSALLDAYEWPEIIMFGLLGVFEACIRTRLIPSNENHPGFFSQMDLPVMITDRELKTAYETNAPVQATNEQLTVSLNAPVYTTRDIRLSGSKIRAGYAFWTEDESTLNRLNEELKGANEVLLKENEILEREQALKAEQAGIEERSRIYQKAAQEVYAVQKKISDILEKAQPGTQGFRSDIEQALVLTAYVKRKANFVLVEAERNTVSAKELASALEESAHYLNYCGINAVVDIKAENTFPIRTAIAAYDLFETVAEDLLKKSEHLFIRLQDKELMIMADAGESLQGGALQDISERPVMSETILPVIQTFADGQLIIRAKLGEVTA